MTSGRSLFALPTILLLLGGTVLPLLILLVISFWSVDFDAFELVPGFGLASWREVLGNPTYPFLIGKASAKRILRFQAVSRSGRIVLKKSVLTAAIKSAEITRRHLPSR